MRDSVRRRRQTAKEIKDKIVERACGKRGFQKKWRLLAAITLTVACYAFYHYYLSSLPADPLDLSSLSEEEKEELRKLETAILTNLTAGSPYQLDRFCDSGNDCFTILQRYWYTNALAAQRLIMYEKDNDMALTMANLEIPEIVTAHHLAHERWHVDHTKLTFSYNLIQIAAGFMLEGLSFGRRNDSQPLQQQRVLQIGLGGGSATGFLVRLPIDFHLDVVELEPNVYEAAKKWFDFPQSPKIAVHIMDGVVFVREAVKRGVTYDSLMLDASSNAPNASIICPHVVFLQEQVLSDLSKVVGSTGVLSVNLFMPQDQERLQEEVARKFAAHFRSCSALKILAMGQKFLVCTNREGFDWNRQRKRMLDNLVEFDAVMGTRVAIHISRLNPALV